MTFLNNIWLLLIVVAILFVWFETDAFPEWAGLFRLRFLKVKEYDEMKKSSLSQVAGKSFPDFLLYKYGHVFFVRLITCPVCLSVWLNLLTMFLFVGNWWWIGFNVIFTWLAYYSVRRIVQ